ncbi:kinetoplast-associated protein, putative [Leishmania tarentolae]|uniref:Kinetoplast-associated protein, putative n=1 Tax=Leishmania tarentolae TaxID=5689 RepID=A0A640KVJ8_LEITA|nr:kinetoplast-associated protein, putative [Leishmania tarentolae]
MLRFIPRRLAIGAYSMFMIEQKNNPKLKGLPVSERGKMTSKLYKSLSPSDKAALDKRAAAYTSFKRGNQKTKAKGEKKTRSPHVPSAYAKFVKENIGRFEKLPRLDRMKAVAKLWKQHNARSGK